MTAFLDLSDICITTRGLATPVPSQPGYAYLPANGEPVIGEQALSQAKVHPTLINNRFWADLDTDPVSPPHPKVRHNADLAWHHLKAYKAAAGDSNFVLLVPSSYSADTLKLLAGICQSLEIKVQAFVNRSVGAVLGGSQGSGSDAVHADLQQHQTILTFLESSDGQLSVSGSERLPGFGLVRLQEHWLHTLRRRFIAGYRFDPMHSGDTEQQLFTQLCAQVGRSQGTPFEFTVNHNGQQYVEQFSEKELAQPYQELLSEIQAKAQGLPLILDHYFEGVPGVGVVDDTVNISISNSDALFEAASTMLGSAEETSADSPFINSAVVSGVNPRSDEAADNRGEKSGASGSKATHILLGGYAHPAGNYEISTSDQTIRLNSQSAETPAHISLNDGILKIGVNADNLKVNAQEATAGQELSAGDIISVTGTSEQLTAITVKTAEKK